MAIAIARGPRVILRRRGGVVKTRAGSEQAREVLAYEHKRSFLVQASPSEGSYVERLSEQTMTRSNFVGCPRAEALDFLAGDSLEVAQQVGEGERVGDASRRDPTGG